MDLTSASEGKNSFMSQEMQKKKSILSEEETPKVTRGLEEKEEIVENFVDQFVKKVDDEEKKRSNFLKIGFIVQKAIWKFKLLRAKRKRLEQEKLEGAEESKEPAEEKEIVVPQQPKKQPATEPLKEEEENLEIIEETQEVHQDVVADEEDEQEQQIKKFFNEISEESGIRSLNCLEEIEDDHDEPRVQKKDTQINVDNEWIERGRTADAPELLNKPKLIPSVSVDTRKNEKEVRVDPGSPSDS